ncbi:MAG: hypothetical protein KJO00_11735 [Bacteroidia bacterium]|nr:hypothetical protein [Bacteroidia bacterium]MBT8288684.1 hypothetical protein [Bacteroidia bacterium]NNK73605.1 hypothetical protein [Flavobacteriaceae bacterium]
MKKLGLILLGILIGIAASYFYFGQDAEAVDNQIAAKVKPPKGLITEAEGIVLDKAFDSRHQLISDSIVKRPDNRSSWYALQDVKDYLDYAENQARGLGYTMDGVRIYLGAHSNSSEGVGYTTMFIVPTGTKGTSEGSMFNFSFYDSGDIPGGDGLNDGGNGYPPPANYPNN